MRITIVAFLCLFGILNHVRLEAGEYLTGRPPFAGVWVITPRPGYDLSAFHHFMAGGRGYTEVTCVGDGRWKSVVVALPGAVCGGDDPRVADLALVNTDPLDDKFHLMKVRKLPVNYILIEVNREFINPIAHPYNVQKKQIRCSTTILHFHRLSSC